MAQHDYNIDDQNGFDFLVDLNNALSAIVTNNAGPSEPNPTFPHMIWFDTNNDLMKVRNEANSEWLIVPKNLNPVFQGVTTTTRLRTTAGNDATPTGTDHPYQIGLDAGLNVRFDDNAIGAFDNGVGSRLTLNRHGGGVDIGSSGVAQDTRIFGQLTTTSPQFTGVPTAPTAATATNTTQIATTAYVRAMAHPLATAGAGVGDFGSIAAPAGAPLVLPAGGTWIYFYLIVNSGGGISGHLSGHAAGGSTIYGGAPDIQPIGWAWRKA